MRSAFTDLTILEARNFPRTACSCVLFFFFFSFFLWPAKFPHYRWRTFDQARRTGDVSAPHWPASNRIEIVTVPPPCACALRSPPFFRSARSIAPVAPFSRGNRESSDRDSPARKLFPGKSSAPRRIPAASSSPGKPEFSLFPRPREQEAGRYRRRCLFLFRAIELHASLVFILVDRDSDFGLRFNRFLSPEEPVSSCRNFLGG